MRLLQLFRRQKPLQRNDFSLLQLLTDSTYLDYRGLPTAVCPCGSDLLLLPVVFDSEREISGYLNEAWCSQCGAMLTVCTADPGEVERYGGFSVD